jgi:dipeptidyl aminopeptidase/acylaminoacyl peptidase
MMRKVAIAVAILGMATTLHLAGALAFTGVPHPPTITAEQVGRVAWGPLFEQAMALWDSRESKGLVTWLPDGSGMLTRERRLLFDSRLHLLASPGGRARFLDEIPRNASVYSRLGRDHMILAWDIDGDEQFSLHRWDLSDQAPVRLTPDGERAVFGAFEPGGNRIAYSSTSRNGRDFDIYVMDPSRPASDHLVLEVEGSWGVSAWSPTGESLLLTHVTSNVSNELYLLDLEDGTRTPISPTSDRPVRHGSVTWSRDGSAIYYTSDRGSEFLHLRRLDLATGREDVLSGDIPWDVSSVQLSGDDRLILVTVNEDGITRHYTTDPTGAAFAPLELFDGGEFTALLHPENGPVLVNHLDPRGRTRGYTYDLRTRALTLWAGAPPSGGDVPAGELIRYPTFDEVEGARRTIPAFVYPGLGDGPRPVMIDIHGGPEGQSRWSAAGSGALQRDGITVITPNVRGSTGYGRTFASLDDVFLREDAVRDIGALLDWIETRPELDAGRVMVTGGSYGGYMVLASLVHFSDRLACGIDIVGVSNFVTFLENTADYRRDLRRAEYGDERIPEVRAFLESISPANHAERIAAPLMVLQGANDPRVPVGESRQMVKAVRASGPEVPYIEGANEGHGFRDPVNTIWTNLARRSMSRACLGVR